MFINDVMQRVYKVTEIKKASGPLKELGLALEKIYTYGGDLVIADVKLTPSEVHELYSIYSELISGAKAGSISMISAKVHEVLDALGFKTRTKGVGWVLCDESVSKVSEGRLYSFKDLPDWAKPIVKDEFGEEQKYSSLYSGPDFVEISYREGGDYLTFRIRPNGMVTAR